MFSIVRSFYNFRQNENEVSVIAAVEKRTNNNINHCLQFTNNSYFYHMKDSVLFQF